MSGAGLRLLRRAGPLVPGALKAPLGRAFGELARTGVLRRLGRLAEGDAVIVAGPWLGEVGFELLYWVPFLAWFAERFEVAPGRIVVVSRGGTHGWYRHVAARYRDVLAHTPPEEYRARNAARAVEVGEQKQVRQTAFDAEVLAPVLAEVDAGPDRVLHPADMYALMRPYWWGHAGPSWVERHARFRRFDPPEALPALERLPDAYTAVKFYYSESFPATPANRAFTRSLVARLQTEGPVVSLSTGLALDDHQGWEEEGSLAAHGIRTDLPPSENLALQSAVVGRARRWVGTYGGFAYLAPFYGVPAEAYYSNPDGFSRRHLDLAQRVFGRFAAGDLLRVVAVP